MKILIKLLQSFVDLKYSIIKLHLQCFYRDTIDGGIDRGPANLCVGEHKDLFFIEIIQ